MELDAQLGWIEWMDDVPPGRDVLRIWDFEKDDELRFDRRNVLSSFSDLNSWGFDWKGWVWDLIHYKMHRVWQGVTTVWLA